MPVGYNSTVDRTQSVEVKTAVWARLDGWPWWPAIVVDRKEREPEVELAFGETLPPESETNRMVQFFYNNDQVAVVDMADICEYTSNIRLVHHSKKLRKDIIAACREANVFIENEGTATQKNLYSNMVPFEQYLLPRSSRQSKSGRGSNSSTRAAANKDDGKQGLPWQGSLTTKRRTRSSLKLEESQRKRLRTSVNAEDDLDENNSEVEDDAPLHSNEENIASLIERVSKKKPVMRPKRLREEDYDDAESCENNPQRSLRSNSNTASEFKGVDDVLCNGKQCEKEVGDTSWSMKRSHTVDKNNSAPPHRLKSSADLTLQFEKFQLAVNQYRSGVMETEYLQKLLEAKKAELKTKHQILSAETRMLKNLPVSRETLADAGVIERLTPCVKSLEEHSPSLVKELSSLAEQWSAQTLVGEVEWEDMATGGDKNQSVGIILYEDKNGDLEAKRQHDERSAIDDEEKMVTKVTRSKPGNGVMNTELENMDTSEIEVNMAYGCRGCIYSNGSQDKNSTAKIPMRKKHKPVDRLITSEDIEMNVREKGMPSRIRDTAENDVRAMNENGGNELKDDMTNELGDVCENPGRESSLALERAKAFNPETNLKALSILIRNPKQASEEVEKMVMRVEKEIRRHATTKLEYYFMSVSVLTLLKKKHNNEKLWTTNSISHLFEFSADNIYGWK